MKSTAKKLAVCAAALCLLACGTAVSAAAASPVSGLALSGVAMPWDQDVPAESIEAGSYTANMLLGSSQQLSPVVRPRNSTDSVVFISDDTSILTVSNSGVVQAVGVGTTRITAAAGNQICAYTIVVSMDSSMIVTEMDLSLSSNTIYVNGGQAAAFRENPDGAGVEGGSGAAGEWKQTEDGRWWYDQGDGTYPAGGWLEIGHKWYFFDAEGYMQTGWIPWNEKEYYCSENGDMLTNCITPDHYLVGEDGAKIAQ